MEMFFTSLWKGMIEISKIRLKTGRILMVLLGFQMMEAMGLTVMLFLIINVIDVENAPLTISVNRSRPVNKFRMISS